MSTSLSEHLVSADFTAVTGHDGPMTVSMGVSAPLQSPPREPNCVEGSPPDALGLVHGQWVHLEPEQSGLRYEVYVCTRCGAMDQD